jgi:hypothetical protein
MAIDRIEVAIACDEVMDEGMEVLAGIVGFLGLDPETDVEAIITSTDDGSPLLLAVLEAESQKEEELENVD